MNPLHQNYELIPPFKPKPSAEEIKSIQSAYYERIAEGYDNLNDVLSRQKYVDSIDRMVAETLCQSTNIDNLIALGSGTGKREADIRAQCGLNFHITCLDSSDEMNSNAVSDEGISLICASIESARLPSNFFDVCVALDLFGVFPNKTERIRVLRSIRNCLKNGGILIVDADNINHNFNEDIRQQFIAEKMQSHGYDLGDRFFRRVDREVVSFWHSFSRDEFEELLLVVGFSIERFCYVSGSTGEICDPADGYLFFIAQYSV